MNKADIGIWKAIHSQALDKTLAALKRGDVMALKHAAIAAVAFDKLRTASMDEGKDYL